jgi:beta-lactamase regulating signal transducer with metallopeptidase domain
MHNEIDSWAVPFLTFSATYWVHSTLLLAGTWFVLRLARVRSWLLRDRLWKLAVVLPFFTASITLPPSISQPILRVTLEGLLPDYSAPQSGRAELIESAVLSTRAVSEAPLVVPNKIAIEDLSPTHLDDMPSNQLQPTENLATGPAWPRQVRPPVPASARAPRYVALVVLFAAICFSILFGATRLAWQSLVFRRMLRGSQQIDSGPILRTLEDVLRAANVRRPIRLLSSKKFAQPAAFGIFRWTIVLPVELIDELPADELRALLAHESAHLVRGDAIWLWIGRVVCACCPLQPLNFVARGGWRRAAEFLCDQWAVRNSANRLALARCLTHVAEWNAGFPPRSAALMAVGGRSSLSERVEWLVSGATTTDAWDTRRRQRLLSFGALAVAFGFMSAAPRARLLAESRPESHRPTAVINDLDDPPPSVAAVTDAKIADSINLLGAEIRQLTNELQLVEKLIQQRQSPDPALRAAATRLAARAALLVQHQQRLAAFAQTPSTPKKGF